MPILEDAAQNLIGLELPNGWTVIEKLERLPGQTGAFFSVCYKVSQENEVCFLKAFDFSKFKHLEHSGKASETMTQMLNAHKYEKDLSDLCRSRHVSKVVTVREAGEIFVEGHTMPLVPYLIFDLADGDVRKRMQYVNDLDVVWKLKSLHTISVGLKQLHGIDVSHQDIKPSNILVFKDDCKIGDIGRSIHRTMESYVRDYTFSGDANYAPPEILYGYHEPDWVKRTFAIDCYMLGSMIAFYFAGSSMTALIRANLPDQFSWEYWDGGPYEDVKVYVLEAYGKALRSFSVCLHSAQLASELTSLVRYLCHPFPEQRGHPKSLNSQYSRYSFERVIQDLSSLYRKAKFNLIK